MTRSPVFVKDQTIANVPAISKKYTTVRGKLPFARCVTNEQPVGAGRMTPVVSEFAGESSYILDFFVSGSLGLTYYVSCTSSPSNRNILSYLRNALWRIRLLAAITVIVTGFVVFAPVSGVHRAELTDARPNASTRWRAFSVIA